MKSGARGLRGERRTECTDVITHSGDNIWADTAAPTTDELGRQLQSMKSISLPTWGCVSGMDRLTKEMSEQAEELVPSSHTATKASAGKSQPWSV